MRHSNKSEGADEATPVAPQARPSGASRRKSKPVQLGGAGEGAGAREEAEEAHQPAPAQGDAGAGDGSAAR